MTFTIAKIKRKQERQAESQLNKLKSTQTKKNTAYHQYWREVAKGTGGSNNSSNSQGTGKLGF